MTPAEMLTQSELVQKLRKLGASDADLESIRFFKFNPDLTFDMWKVTGPAWLILKHQGLCKAFCAYRWLILENPPSSQNTARAWDYITHVLSADIYDLGIATKENQKKRAAKSRAAIGDSGETIDALVGALIRKPEYRSLSAKELWPHLYAAFAEHDLAPKEGRHATGDIRKASISYDFRDKRRRISFGTFANLLSRLRKKSP